MPTLTADPTLAADAADLYDALSELVRIYQFRDRERICCYDISLTQANALDAVVRRGPLSMNDLAGHLVLDKSTTSRAVASLERKGLVVREEDPQDRRALLLRGSDSGAALHRNITREIHEREMGVLEGFDPAVRRQMIEMVSRLKSAAGERVTTTKGSCCCTDC